MTLITRRHFLASTAVPFLVPYSAFAESPMKLRAEFVQTALLPNKTPTSLWGFNGSSPGPTIRAKKTERVKVRFENALSKASSVHWHGIRIENTMDGVPELTQSPVDPESDFLYDFVAPDAGTYWYHSHNRSWEQVARGLYGALIVEEDNPPQVEHDIVVFIDDWRLNSDGSQAGNFESMHDQSHQGRLGNFFKAVFQGITTPIKRYQRIRLRLINVATDRVFPLQLTGLQGKVVAHDGMPLEIPAPIENLVLAPAQRTDIIADIMGDEIAVDFLTRDGFYRLGSLELEGEDAQKTSTAILPLEPNRYQSPVLSDAVSIRVEMEGGAMSRQMMLGGMISGNLWTFNGVAGMPKEPLYQFQRGQSAIIDLVNDTSFAHAIHLHGHHFQAINSGDSGDLLPLRDTILVEAGQSQKIACVFDNPGKWLLHCHMLAHQAAGMKTWVQVT